MLNIEKYRDDILNTELTHINCCVNYLSNKGICFKNCKDCKKAAMEWLLSEYKEHILDDVEKEYLSAVIRPFRKKVMDVVKVQYCEGKQRIWIRVSYGDCAELPFFKNNTMYKGMKVGKYYTPEELGL